MFQKASVLDINLSFQCNSDIYNIIPEYIPDVDLSTLIADLLENAIIATKTEQNRKTPYRFVCEAIRCFVLLI